MINGLIGIAMAAVFVSAWMFAMALIARGVIWLCLEKADGAWWGFPAWMALAIPLLGICIAGLFYFGYTGFCIGNGACFR